MSNAKKTKRFKVLEFLLEKFHECLIFEQNAGKLKLDYLKRR